MTAQPLRIDERNHVEKPLLAQLAGLGWEIVDLDRKQRPADSFRVINPRLDEDQVEEAARRLIAGFPGTGLLENNRYVFDLLLSNTSVSESRRAGERSPTVRLNGTAASLCLGLVVAPSGYFPAGGCVGGSGRHRNDRLHGIGVVEPGLIGVGR